MRQKALRGYKCQLDLCISICITYLFHYVMLHFIMWSTNKSVNKRSIISNRKAMLANIWKKLSKYSKLSTCGFYTTITPCTKLRLLLIPDVYVFMSIFVTSNVVSSLSVCVYVSARVWCSNSPTLMPHLHNWEPFTNRARTVYKICQTVQSISYTMASWNLVNWLLVYSL